MRGSRPGERRGGRKKGTPNKKTAYVRAVTAAYSANPNPTPMEVMLAVMRDPYVALDVRLKMALRLLPRLHRKLGAGETACVASGQNLGPQHRPNPSPAALQIDDDLVENPVYRHNGAARSPANGGSEDASVAPQNADQGGHGAELMPLAFLLEVLHNANIPAPMKVKVASATLPYTQPKQSKRPATPTVVADRWGFVVDPVLAKKLCNQMARLSVLKKRRKSTAKDRAAAQKLGEKIETKLATLQCPSVEEYPAKDAARDKDRMLYLWRKRRSRAKLTPNEDTELAHVNARYWAYKLGPEGRARDRLRSLREKARLHLKSFGPPLNPWEKGELSVLTTVYRPIKIKLARDSEDFLERHSIFSDCEYDAEGFPVDYRRSDPSAPEGTHARTLEATASQPNDPAPQLGNRNPSEEELTSSPTHAP
jgi:hypothetical protein